MNSVQTIQKRILSDRQQDFGSEDQVIFNLNPSDIQVLAGKNSYLKMDFTITVPEGSSPAKCSLDYFGGGGYSLIDRLQVWSLGAGSQLLENCEEVPALVGTQNYYSETPGLKSQRNLFEGLNSNDGTSADTYNSQFYSMLTCDGNPHFETLSLCLPLKFSGTLFGRVFPVAACGGVQVRLMLSSTAKALKADLGAGMIVQRDRTGRAPELQDLPYTTAQLTSIPPFTTGTNPYVGEVSQALPSLFQLAGGGGGAGDLTVGAIILAAQISQQPTTATAAITTTDAATSTTGNGTGLTVTIVMSAVAGVIAVGGLTVGTTAGSNYEPGDNVSVALGLIAGATVDLTFSLSAADFSAPTNLTSVDVLKTNGYFGSTAGIPQMNIAGTAPALMHSNVLATNDTFASLLGQGFYAVDDAGTLIDLTANSPGGISAVDATDPNFIKVSWATASTTPASFTVANNCPCFGAVLDPNIVSQHGQNLSYKVENIQLVCENVSEKGYVAAMMSKVKSQGGLTLDIKTYNVLRQNLFKSQTVSQLLIPTTSFRTKALLQHMQYPVENLVSSYWQPLNDNLRQYSYLVKDKNTPNRAVLTNLEYAPAQPTWNVVCDHERTKTLEAAGFKVRKEVSPSGRFVFGRALSTPGGSFNANRNQCRLTQSWGILRDIGGGVVQNVLPQFDKNMLTFVPHFRKIQMQGDNVVVTY